MNTNQNQPDENCLKMIDALQQNLIRVNEKLKESEEMKTNFISNIMNELVNPFASIVGLAQQIMALKDHQMDQARSFATLIYNEAFHLDFQLNNIFMAAKIEAGEINPELAIVNPDNLFQGILSAFSGETQRQNVSIRYSYTDECSAKPAGYFTTDPEKLRIVVSNLLSNALKFSTPGQTVSFTCHAKEEGICIAIQDKGKGISEAGLQEIFDRFKQLDSTIHTLNSGYGLGLSITAALIDLLHGEIRVESRAGEGSTFYITIPQSNTPGDALSSTDDTMFFTEEVF